MFEGFRMDLYDSGHGPATKYYDYSSEYSGSIECW
jgi:hypothetical protein